MKIDRIKAEIDIFKHIANSFSVFFLATATGLFNKWQILNNVVKIGGIVAVFVLVFCIFFFKIRLFLHAKLLEKL
jgi:hypothetical protein